MSLPAKLKQQPFKTAMNMSFDALKFAETLIAGGFSNSQAKALSTAQNEVVAEALNNTLATKTDIQRLENSIDSLEHRIDGMDIKIGHKENNSNTKTDHAVVGFSHEFPLLYWIGGLLISTQVAILLKLFI